MEYRNFGQSVDAFKIKKILVVLLLLCICRGSDLGTHVDTKLTLLSLLQYMNRIYR